MCEELWDEFTQDDEVGSCFALKAVVAQKRLVVRWKGTLQNRAVTEKDVIKRARTASGVKKLQLIEMTMILHAKHRNRGADEELALKSFENSFQSLLSFAGADLSQEYQCRYICGLRLQLKALSSLPSSRGLAISASISC